MITDVVVYDRPGLIALLINMGFQYETLSKMTDLELVECLDAVLHEE